MILLPSGQCGVISTVWYRSTSCWCSGWLACALHVQLLAESLLVGVPSASWSNPEKPLQQHCDVWPRRPDRNQCDWVHCFRHVITYARQEAVLYPLVNSDCCAKVYLLLNVTSSVNCGKHLRRQLTSSWCKNRKQSGSRERRDYRSS